jgi:Carboxypeptidase regulatory-like domain
MAKSFFVGLLMLGTSLMPSLAAAQTRATSADLSGVVLDESKAVLPGAMVTATNAETNQARTVVTDGNGRFFIPALPPGLYVVSAELSGFAPQTRQGILLQLGTSVTLDFTLKIAGTREEITVKAPAPLIDTQQTAVSTVVSQKQIESLPINGRNFMSFSIITPGVSTDRTPQQGASATSGLTFAGQRARSNNITVDGLDNNDAALGSVRATFSQEAVREFQVLTNSYSAEFGKASGGVVNIVTKSGTNTVAGNAFVYARDDALNRKGYFERFNPAGQSITQQKAPYSQKQFGSTLGGPIRKDQTFFFGSFERLDVKASNFVTIDDTTRVPGPAGGFLGTPAAILRAAGFPVETGNIPFAVNGDQFLVKVDHQVSRTQGLVLRFNYADSFNENIEPFGGIVAKSRAAALDATDYMAAMSYTAVSGTRLVNELRFQFARRDQTISSLDPNCGGPCVGENQGGPTLEVLGVASVGRQRFTPQPRLSDRSQVLDTLSYYVGNHQIKSGFDFNYIDNPNGRLPLHFGGRYIFAALPAIPGLLPVPVSAIQAVALGLPARYVQGYGETLSPYLYRDISLFAQDDWRVTPNVTVKLGVRYQDQLWPGIQYNVAGAAPYTFPSDHNNVAPRLSVAWDPRSDQKTSVHASYGLFYDNHITSVVGITEGISGGSNVRTYVAGLPTSVAAWNAPGHKLPEPSTAYPSLVISIDPGLQTPYAHHASVGIDRELRGQMSVSASIVYARGFNQLGTIDYNPIVPSLGAGRRPADVGGRAGTSASVLQYTSFGETWYDGLTLSATKRFTNRCQFLASYTLSKAEDNSTDFQSAFVPQTMGRGRSDAASTGLPIGFNPDDERGPSLQDQRHRFVLSGLYVAPGRVQVSSIVTIASGRPYNILAGADLNGDGDGGTSSPDRARQNPASEASSVSRNTGLMPHQATVDLRVSRRFRLAGKVSAEGLVEVFNLFNRTNFVEVNNIFGAGAYPSTPLATFGQFTQTASPLQMQLAAKIYF